MDDSRFDSLTRALVSSRRGTVKVLLGGALGALVLGRSGEEAAAGCKKPGKKCDKTKDCCDGAKCKGGKKGKCRCKSGLTSCAGEKACKDLDKDIEHCGACGNACAAGEVCCDGVCIDVENDRANCGDCGVACAPSEICSESACLPCPIGNEICGDVCCPPFETCTAGVCLICQPTAPLCGDSCCGIDNCCGGVCVDLETSRVNCGACFNLCDVDETCIGGVCRTPA